MWGAFRLFVPSHTLPSEYGDLVHDAPYPMSLPVSPSAKIKLSLMTRVMRYSYQGTPYDLTTGAQKSTLTELSLTFGIGMAAGPWGSPDRWAPGAAEEKVKGSWERSIAIVRTIVSYVLHVRSWLPRQVGATLWFAPHASHTSCYVPFPAGMTTVPSQYSNNSLARVDRGRSAYQASRFVFNIAQLKFSYMIQDIEAAQAFYENRSATLEHAVTQRYLTDGNLSAVEEAYSHNAEDVVAAWWDLSDQLLLHYADGYCNDCGRAPRHVGYPAWWLEAVNYTHGPSE